MRLINIKNNPSLLYDIPVFQYWCALQINNYEEILTFQNELLELITNIYE